jgi:hypothetical protein
MLSHYPTLIESSIRFLKESVKLRNDLSKKRKVKARRQDDIPLASGYEI